MRSLVILDEMLFGFMPGKGTLDLVYSTKDARGISSKRKNMCCADLEKIGVID